MSNNISEKVDIDNTDGRARDNVKSRYDDLIKKEIWQETAFLISLVVICLGLLLCTWTGSIFHILCIPEPLQLQAKKYLYFALSGMLGGLTFGMKYFYRVVARGWWNQDRRIWRLMSPIISAIIALMVGILIEASFINTGKILNGTTIISIGFLSGYFADEAVGKMYEIANVIFGTNNNNKS